MVLSPSSHKFDIILCYFLSFLATQFIISVNSIPTSSAFSYSTSINCQRKQMKRQSWDKYHLLLKSKLIDSLDEISSSRDSLDRSECNQKCIGAKIVRGSNEEKEIPMNISPGVSRSAFLSTLGASILATAAIPSSSNAETISKNTLRNIASTNTATSQVLSAETKHATTNVLSSAIQETISGFASGAALSTTKTLVKYPLDTATVRLQMPGTTYSIRNLPKLFNGSFNGITAPLLSNIPAGAIFFSVKDATKATLKESGLGLPKWAATCIAVAVAQPPYWLVRNPSEVVKTRQQAGIEGYEDNVSVVDAFKLATSESDNTDVGRGGGVKELYSGYLENILYAYPADVIKFVMYEFFSGGKKNLPPLEGAVYGAASTAVAQMVTTPLDVVRNRIMAGEKTGETQNNEEQLSSNTRRLSYVKTLKKLAREEGVSGLFAGVSPRIGKAILSGAIQFATYEETKQSINRMFERK